jgi:hypothetical protein
MKSANIERDIGRAPVGSLGRDGDVSIRDLAFKFVGHPLRVEYPRRDFAEKVPGLFEIPRDIIL